MPKDTRIFKVTRVNGRVQYANYRSVAGMFGTGVYGAGGHTVARVEAVNAEATAGWTDCTEEFRNPALPGYERCSRHKAYTGTRKPSYRWYADKWCTCWRLYSSLHPDYPQHSDYCHQLASDPEHCDCKMAAKLLG
jgi:hypothetical protein